MPRVGVPAISPDGTRAVVAVLEPAYDDKQQASDLWIVPTDGSAPPRRLTSTPGGENGVAWSQDGTRVAFSARRGDDEAPQIYVIDVVHGGEAQRVTQVSTGARAPRWRPDGTAILFTSDVYPGARTDAENKAAAAERKARPYTARVYDSFPVRDFDRWLDDRHASLLLQPLTPGAPARDLLAGSALVTGPGFSGQVGSGAENIAAAWVPDGSGVVFAASVNRAEAARAEVVTALWFVDAAGGEPRRLTPGEESFGAPTFSPDGSTLYAVMEPASDRVYVMGRLVRFAWPAMGTARQVAPAFDRPIASPQVTADGARLVFTAEDQGHERLYTLPSTGGTPVEVGSLDAGTLTGVDVGGPAAAPTVVALWQSAAHPPEVVRVDLATGARTPLTRFTESRVAALDLPRPEAFWFTSSRGTRVHSLLVRPPNFDPAKKYPLFVVMHGGPHGAWRDEWVLRWNYHLLGAPGYVVLLTNYIGSTGFGEAFAQKIQGDPLEGPAIEINEAADEAIRRFPFIDATRQVAGGASYGGHLANWMGVTTTRYRALVSHAGLFDLAAQWGTSDIAYSRERNMGGPVWKDPATWAKQSPLFRADKLKTPMLVTVGERDYRVPANNALQLFVSLQRQQVPSRLIVFPEENHWILRAENSRFFYREVHGWLAKWLGAN
ncbi:S9 family peptidase [Luteitalea sp.]|jgi:dipeptidyl aminopeptidase/acylaminoacyl peptidase|uniref:S9 family peptidase n=1 Tax=Luteitalea sp. TaxID=2004800 RepID=UPI0037C8E37C